MFKASSALKAGVATIALTGLVFGVSTAANADPATGTFKTYAAVGSDTTQDLWNALSAGVTTNIGSYNAFATATLPATIQTKSGGATFARPAGSGNGIKALSAAWDPANHVWMGTTLSNSDVDFARSSSTPANVTGGALTHLRFARDAVSVAYNPYTTGAAINLTPGQLTELYSGVDNTGDSVVTFVSGAPRINGTAAFPKLPQSGSGTRSFFLGAIGVATPAGYVETTTAPSTLPENDGSAIATDGALIPFSAAQWIAQNQTAATGIADTTGGLVLASINGVAAVTGSGATATPGALYGTTNAAGSYDVIPATGLGAFSRDTFNVVPTRFLGDDATDAQIDLVAALTDGLGTTAARTTITKFGFGNLSYLGKNSITTAFQH